MVNALADVKLTTASLGAYFSLALAGVRCGMSDTDAAFGWKKKEQTKKRYLLGARQSEIGVKSCTAKD